MSETVPVLGFDFPREGGGYDFVPSSFLVPPDAPVIDMARITDCVFLIGGRRYRLQLLPEILTPGERAELERKVEEDRREAVALGKAILGDLAARGVTAEQFGRGADALSQALPPS